MKNQSDCFNVLLNKICLVYIKYLSFIYKIYHVSVTTLHKGDEQGIIRNFLI